MNPNLTSEQQEAAQEEQLKNIHNPLAVMQPGERVICEINRHPIGIIGMYVMAGLVVCVLAIVVFIILPLVLPDVARARLIGLGGLGFMVVLAVTLLFMYIGNAVYRGNRWIVTSDSITQVQQVSLFSKQNSQLSMANLEDVTVEQNGILTHMFNYGIITAETAGEHSKFKFLYCPKPNYYAQQILNAREQFEQERRGYPAPQMQQQPNIPQSQNHY